MQNICHVVWTRNTRHQVTQNAPKKYDTRLEKNQYNRRKNPASQKFKTKGRDYQKKNWWSEYIVSDHKRERYRSCDTHYMWKLKKKLIFGHNIGRKALWSDQKISSNKASMLKNSDSFQMPSTRSWISSATSNSIPLRSNDVAMFHKKSATQSTAVRLALFADFAPTSHERAALHIT